MRDPLAFRRYLRRRETSAERLPWHLLRDRRLVSVKFRRQHPVGPFVADFVAVEARLVIEVDGWTHEGREQAAATRDRLMRQMGFRVLRFPGFQVTTNPEVVLRQIVGWLTATVVDDGSPLTPGLAPLRGARGARTPAAGGGGRKLRLDPGQYPGCG